MTATKISRIISGSPVRPITVGEPALIHEGGGLRRTTPVVDVRRVSSGEIRFETRNTRCVLKIIYVSDKYRFQTAQHFHSRP